MPKNLKNNKQAFTLLELLIVMVILAILSGLGLVAFGTAQQKARDNRRKQDLGNIVKVLETYYNDFGKYPDSDINGAILGCHAGAIQTCTWGEMWNNSTNETLYMTQLPKDPAKGINYYYQNYSGGYYLFAFLENEKDPAAAKTVAGDPAFYQTANCQNSANSCNYFVSSSNMVHQPTLIVP